MIRLLACDFLIVLILATSTTAQETVQREQHFDRDPQWEGLNNRITRDRYPTITQDFGWQADGRIGGQIWRSSTPASYAIPIEPATLDQPLSASGTLAIPETHSGGGVLFGWFNHQFTPGMRP